MVVNICPIFSPVVIVACCSHGFVEGFWSFAMRSLTHGVRRMATVVAKSSDIVSLVHTQICNGILILWKFSNQMVSAHVLDRNLREFIYGESRSLVNAMQP